MGPNNNNQCENKPLRDKPRTSSYGGTSLRDAARNDNNNGRNNSRSPPSSSDPLSISTHSHSHYSEGNLRRHAPGENDHSDRRSSILALLAGGLPSHTQRRQSVVLAPPSSDLPPGTPLLGSSRLFANTLNADMKLRRRKSLPPADKTPEEENGYGNEDDDYEPGYSEENSTLETMASTVAEAHTLKEIEDEYNTKTRTTFYNDAMTFAEGTIPQSIVIATVIGIVCGVVAYLYYFVLDTLLVLIWDVMPEAFVVDKWPEHLYVLWIPLVSFSLSVCCGLSIYYLGEPGDLAYTIKCVHEKGYKAPHHIAPMVASSLFSILAGSSLGPEAPLVAICAATAGIISKNVFKQKNTNVIRKHTFMGMSGALSAFFGVPLGGSLFALEVTSRFGVEYFEHLIEAIFAGEICVTVFRSLAGLPLAQIWANENTPTVLESDPYMIMLGIAIGLLGAGLAYLWANFHWRLMAFFKMLGLLDDDNIYAVPRVLLGGTGVVLIGMLVPQTMFWGEFEFPVLATLSHASRLPHVWPTAGLIGFEMNSCMNCLIVGFSKLLAISFTVAGGYRGGYIFPFFTAGAAFGRALCFAFPKLNPAIATLCFAAGINVAITRTALATSLILAFLSGEQLALPAVLAASIASLFATGYMPFIKSQIARSDIDFSLYYRRNREQSGLE